MASSLTITTGALTATLGSQDDAAVQNVLLNFAYATGAEEAWTAQQKLDHVAAQLAEYMRDVAREKYYQLQSASIRQDSIQQVHW
jgi:hypothetical protein